MGAGAGAGAGAAAACFPDASSMARAATFSAFDLPDASFLKKDEICFPMGFPPACRRSSGMRFFFFLTGPAGAGAGGDAVDPLAFDEHDFGEFGQPALRALTPKRHV